MRSHSSTSSGRAGSLTWRVFLDKPMMIYIHDAPVEVQTNGLIFRAYFAEVCSEDH